METAVERLCAVHFLVIGLSHVARPREWAELFILLRAKGTVGSFANASLPLVLGSLIVSFHNVWTGLPLVLTLVGWMYVLKGLLYFLFPGLGLRTLDRVTLDRSREFVHAGALLIGLGIFSVYVSLGIS